MGYTGKALKGVTWLGLIRVVTRFLSFAKILIIARVLSPSQFGAFGIAILILVLVEILTETGINIFLIQKKGNIDKYINTSWLVSIARGIIIALLIIAAAPLVSNFFKASASLNLLFFVAAVAFLRGFINPSIVKFQKELMFNKEFYFRGSTFFVETFFSVFLVILTRTPEALIWGMIIGVIFEIILSFFIVKPVPKFSFKFPIFKEVVGYGKWITGATIFNYFYQHGDDMAVGRMLGTTSLGLYDMAYKISLVPVSDIADVITRVTFPVYVKISGDQKRLKRAFLKTLAALFLLVSPVAIVFFVFPKEIVSIVLGDKWLLIVPVLKVLAIFSIVRSVSVFTSSIFLSLQKQSVVTLISFVGVLGLGVTIVPFVLMWGIVGASLSALFGTALTIPVIFYYLFKIKLL